MFRDHGILGGISCDKDQEGFFRGGAPAEFIEEVHRVWCVDQSGKPGFLAGSDEEAGGDADAFVDIVIFLFLARRRTA